jgi:hypothetical protein
MKRALLAVLFAVLCVGVQGQTRGGLQNLSVDFMTRGYFFAGSRIVDKDAPGGFGPSDNFPRAIAPGMKVPEGQLSLVVLPDEESVFAKKYRGLKVLVVNSTTDTVGLAASDSRLNIVQEALDRDGQWKPIEYLPSSWCGNSYHTVFLGSNEYWEFDAARYSGRFKTKIRVTLNQRISNDQMMVIHSNEYDGGVNPNQFKVQQGHKPTNIMDPYNN